MEMIYCAFVIPPEWRVALQEEGKRNDRSFSYEVRRMVKEGMLKRGLINEKGEVIKDKRDGN